MAEISRRQFIEAAGLAAAAPAFANAAAAAQRGENRADAARRTTRAADLSDAELEAMFKRCSNTGNGQSPIPAAHSAAGIHSCSV